MYLLGIIDLKVTQIKSGCNRPILGYWVLILHEDSTNWHLFSLIGVYIALFMQFFYNAYMKKKNKKDSKKDSKKDGKKDGKKTTEPTRKSKRIQEQSKRSAGAEKDSKKIK